MTATSPSKETILVADDEASIRRILETRLSMIGYQVVTACDGNEALDLFRNCEPDLVVLDVMMPKLDGYGVCQEQAVVLSAGVGFLFVLGCLVFFIVPDLIIANIYIVLALLLLSLVSFYDDLKGLSNKFRIFIHFLVGNVFYFSNIKFLSLNLFFLDIVLNDYVSYFCTVFFVVALINIYNFIG